MDEVRVISSDLDGAQLRREKAKTSRYARCDGKEDNEELQDAIDRVGGGQWVMSAEAWERVFGGERGRR